MKERLQNMFGWIRGIISSSAPFIVRIIPDMIFVCGLCILSYGAWQAWYPLGPIVFGGAICAPIIITRIRGA